MKNGIERKKLIVLATAICFASFAAVVTALVLGFLLSGVTKVADVDAYICLVACLTAIVVCTVVCAAVAAVKLIRMFVRRDDNEAPQSERDNERE